LVEVQKIASYASLHGNKAAVQAMVNSSSSAEIAVQCFTNLSSKSIVLSVL